MMTHIAATQFQNLNYTTTTQMMKHYAKVANHLGVI
ncbi:Uncharacterised protein [Serratia marcescens]|nr:Uncharacterised protein [Serratia marcescens]